MGLRAGGSDHHREPSAISHPGSSHQRTPPWAFWACVLHLSDLKAQRPSTPASCPAPTGTRACLTSSWGRPHAVPEDVPPQHSAGNEGFQGAEETQ